MNYFIKDFKEIYSYKSSALQSMQNQELFLLTILKFPVIIIKFMAKVLAVLTYLPSYAILRIIDAILFNQILDSSLINYVLTWIPRVLLLISTFALFTTEFYLIFSFLDLKQHGIIVQILGTLFAFAGLLILMRKGYLSMLKKYNLTKLKSPMEHIQLGLDYMVDCIGIILWMINALLLVKISKSWQYNYNPHTKFQFIRHISGLIRQSILFYLDIFYVKFIFKLFPWRFTKELETYQKQKQGKNVLNCAVLLNLVYFLTLLDIIVIILLGWGCVLHFCRKKYIEQMRNNEQKYKITLKYFIFIVGHMFQFIILISCTIFCWKNGFHALKRWRHFTSTKQLFKQQFTDLLIETLFKIPYLICLLFLLLSIYKYKRMKHLIQKQNNSKVAHAQVKIDNNEQIYIKFKCFYQLSVDILCLPFIIFSSLAKIWNIWWIKYIINDQYLMNRNLIIIYFSRNLVDLCILPIAIPVTIITLVYDAKKPFRLFSKSVDELKYKQNYYIQKNPHENLTIYQLQCYTYLQIYTTNIVVSLWQNYQYLPQFLITKMTFLNIYKPQITPNTTNHLYYYIQETYYYLSTKRSHRFQDYQNMFNRIKASGGITSSIEESRFWKFAHKCQRLILIQKIIAFFLPKKIVQRVESKMLKETQFSQISNEYWYQSQLVSALLKRQLFLIIQIILSIIGIFLLLPLTLWRIPTCVKLINHHRSKKFFFPILFKIYEQMLWDVISIPLKLLAVVIAPRIYLSFIVRTAFNYGPAGLDTFSIYQICKINYFKNEIIKANLKIILINLETIFILVFWIRIKTLKILLRTQRFTIKTLYKDVIFSFPSVPSMEAMITQPNYHLLTQTTKIQEIVSQVFVQAIKDFPYIFLILLIFVTMPWRINYLLQAIRDMREDSSERKLFFKLLQNFAKDYACIFMNILLLISIIKTKKALFLIRRNYRLNFFIGFLQYSYYRQLKIQLLNLAIIYKNISFLVIGCLFQWTNTQTVLNQLQQFRKKEKETEQNALANKKIYENTVKSGKELQTLHKMGYYNYLNVCSFLNLSEIMTLRQVDKFNYMMTQRQQIWFTKWELTYSKISNDEDQNYQKRCQNAYLSSRRDENKPTYESIIMRHFIRSVYQQQIDFTIALSNKIPTKYYDMIFKNYSFSITQGYGPQNQLPQAQNEDQEFLRLTNQVRRPKLPLTEEETWLHLLYFRPIQYLIQKLHKFFRVDRIRRRKQLIFLLLVSSIVIAYLSFIWIFKWEIFRIDDLIGIKIVFGFYSISFPFVIFMRFMHLRQSWISLIPFDIYHDIINFFKKYFIDPIIKLYKFSKLFIIMIGRQTYSKGTQIGKAIANKIRLVLIKIKAVLVKGKDITTKYSIIFYEKVVKPLYLFIADKIRLIGAFFAKLFVQLYKSIKSLLAFLGSVVTSLYEAIKTIFSNINKLYYLILEKSMISLLRFGVLGNLAFTLFGLGVMTSPSLIWWLFYPQWWYLIVSTIHTMVLIVVGYKHLNKIKGNLH